MHTLFLWLSALALTVQACPWISEVHADPTQLPDAQGEFFEIVNINTNISSTDTLRIFLDADTLGIFIPTDEENSTQVFCHQDSLRLLPAFPVPCKLFTKALPNTRPLQIAATQGLCRDTAYLEPAQPGKSWQRTTQPPAQAIWEKAEPTPGFAAQGSGSNAYNAWISIDQIHQNSLTHSVVVSVHDSMPQSFTEHPLKLIAKWQQLGTQEFMQNDTQPITQASPLTLEFRGTPSPWMLLHLELIGDEYPLDNRLDTLLIDSPPLRISEVAPCPAKPWPEWFEVTNLTPYPINLADISHCKPMLDTTSLETLAPQGRAVITDSRTKLLVAMPGLAQTPILQTAQSLALSNSGDTLRLCFQGHTIDSVFWKSLSTSTCGQSFRVAADSLLHTTPSPGWQPKVSSYIYPPKLLTRIVSKTNPAHEFHVRIPLLDKPWSLDIASEDGSLWLRSAKIETTEFTWTPPAHVHIGSALAVLHAPDSTQTRIPFVIIP